MHETSATALIADVEKSEHIATGLKATITPP
jgi:hypothetical protein